MYHHLHMSLQKCNCLSILLQAEVITNNYNNNNTNGLFNRSTEWLVAVKFITLEKTLHYVQFKYKSDVWKSR